MKPFLKCSKYIDYDNPEVDRTARSLAQGTNYQSEVIQRCFEFVRDEIHHSWDYKQNPVTCRASDVLHHRTGYCYAKSHLLAALLRANGIPTGFCYQRLSVGESGPPYSLHGLNAVYLNGHGWYRIDARGNKPGVSAQFTPPTESLAFHIREEGERDFPEILAEPLLLIISTLEHYDTIEQVHQNLPDLQSITGSQESS